MVTPKVSEACFVSDFPVAHTLVKDMTCNDASLRPNTEEILNNELLKDFAYTQLEMKRRSRSQTISESSKE